MTNLSGNASPIKPARMAGRRPALLALPVLAVVFAALAGALLSLGSAQITIVVVALILAPIVLALSPTALLSSFLFASFFLAGMLQYFGKVTQAHWLPSLVLLVMIIRIPMDAMSARPSTGAAASGRTLLLSILLVYLALIGASAALNMTSPLQLLVGARHYVFPFALIALLMQRDISRLAWEHIWQAVPYLVIAQFPVACYQYFFVARVRAAALTDAGIAWDAVVGTFGGDPDKGGASGAMALFLAFGLATSYLLRSSGRISRRLFLGALVCGLGTMLIAEIKVIIVYLPLAIFVARRRAILRSPGSAALWLVAGGMFVVCLFAVYNALFWNNAPGQKQRDLSEAFEYAFQTERSSGFENTQTGEVSRLGAVVRWAESNPGSGDALGTLLGHGPAASKISSIFGFGDAAKKFRYNLTTSSLSAMLWDLGLLGVAAYLALAGAGLLLASQAEARLRSWRPQEAAMCDAAMVGIVLVLASLAYNMDALNIAAIQAVFFTAIGYALVARQWAAEIPHKTTPGRAAR